MQYIGLITGIENTRLGDLRQDRYLCLFNVLEVVSDLSGSNPVERTSSEDVPRRPGGLSYTYRLLAPVHVIAQGFDLAFWYLRET